MTVVPLTQASHRLGIDVKTLRRWLAEAQCPPQSDPLDARKKGVRLEHLHLLATHHQRSLAPLSASLDASAQEAVSPAPLPATLLAVPETLEALQAQIAALHQQIAALHQQIAALHQQIAALTHLLQHPVPPPAHPEKRRSRPARPASRR